MRDCDCECTHYFNVTPQEEQYHLSDFDFENLHIRTENSGFAPDIVENMTVKNVRVETSLAD
ncbi:MAG TPA: hypothetical protein H9955_09870 [Candidatus Mediterraneibacter cottocaccae]|nr:hypothetical protein [Candidatus Mediterraneibacter cottocaccae]